MKTSLRKLLAFLITLPLAASAAVFTTDTAISPSLALYDGQDIVVSNATLTVDGAHTFASLLVGPGGTLTHSFSASGSITITNSIMDEPQLLAGTNDVTLAVANVLAETVLVRDATGTITYTNTTDYLVTIVGAQGFLRRSDTSAIPDGAMVLVSYSAIGGTTAAGLNLTLTGGLEVTSGGFINANGRGFGGNTGTGNGGETGSPLSGAGAGYGGYGGNSSSNAIGGPTYNSFQQPALLGSGGGHGAGGVGGSGGGLIRLTVSSNALINGTISANGADATNNRAGGGSGGSVWITAQSIAGAGTITAHGGAGEPIHGGGGGGRIALYSETNNFGGATIAYGGPGWNSGGAGTVYFRSTLASSGLVLVDAGGRAGTNTPVAITAGDDLLVRSNGNVLPSGNWSAGNVTVLAGAAITADATGSPAGSGSGPGSVNNSDANRPCSGGGHGGYGAAASTNVTGGNVYGSLGTPTAPGSGGGTYTTISIGGAGGGAMQLSVSGTLWVDGRISANGGNGAGSGGGGGSGGSLYLTATTLAGSGSITADGGNAPILFGGGGGGGRIALYPATNLFTGNLTAYGGIGAKIGGAGTVYSRTGGGVPLVLVDNGGRAGTNTSLGLIYTPDVLVRGNAVAVPSASWTAHDVTIASNSSIAVVGPNSTLTINANKITIEPTGGVVADGAGSGAGSGSGPGGTYAGGGGHGGTGGNGATNGLGGVTYGSPTTPTTFGSGGGNATTGSNPGGAGGGAIRLNVTDDLIVDGRVSANGRTSALGGGGAGGSVWLSAGRMMGAGSVTANGGSCAGPIGGGGGGGRIALLPTTNSFSGSLTAYGGSGFVRGGAGTVYVEGPGPAGPILRQLILDNGGVVGTNTPLTSLSTSDLIVRNGAIGTVALFSGSFVTFGNLVVETNGVLIPLGGVNGSLAFANALVASGGAIHADGFGGSTQGTGVGALSSSGSTYNCGGGGYGGYGGMGGTTNARGGNSYGSATFPGIGGNTGSPGGGSGSSFTPFGGMGGGLLNMRVTGSLTNNGRISADGKIGSGNYAGGGSGGSITLALGKLLGTGVVSANGGPGILPGGGGGGGGRIAITFDTNAYVGSVSAFGGSGINYGGAGTIYLKPNQSNAGQLIVDNGGNAGTNTTYNSSSAADLVVSGRGVVVLPSGSSALHNLTIKTNGALLATTSTSLQTLNVSGSVTIDPGGVFSLDSTGYGGGLGTGAGLMVSPRGGASHGGFGALNAGSAGAAYGSISGPTTAGSGGGNGSGSTFAPFGGAGGGALHLTVIWPRVLTVNGRLSANGKDGDLNSGGGSGGSLWLSAGALAGSGVISANGGAGIGSAGGGGGGRIAITYTSNSFSGTLSAFGGGGAVGGGAGTIYTKEIAPVAGLLLVDNGGLAGTNTPLSSAYTFPGSGFNLTLSGGATALALTPLPLLSNLTIGAGSTLTTRPNESNIYLATLGDVQIAPGGALAVDGKGFARSAGPGAGAALASKGAGGGYGGLGGNAQSGALGGTNYGSAAQPVDRGSGGGAGANTYLGGCEGGGAIRLSVGGTLNVDGSLTANGNPGWQDDSGGGAGGSIWVTANAVSGNGIISANGGDGDLYGGGGGGGGRIAIYSPSNQFAGLPTVAGGFGANVGQTGTVWLATNFLGFQALSHSPVGVVSNTVSSVDLTFSDAVAAGSVAGADFALFTPAGALDAANFSAAVVGLTTVRVSFPPQNLLGDYRLEVGPDIQDVLGQPMSQVYTGAFTVVLPTISGVVTNASGQPVAGVALQPSGVLTAVLTDTNGAYSLGVPPDWTGTVTPALGTNIFLPAALSYTNFAGSVTNQDFLMVETIAPVLRSALNGTNCFLNWSGIPGVTYQAWSSTNLVDWLPFGPPLSGTNGVMELWLPVTGKPLEFLRLKASN